MMELNSIFRSICLEPANYFEKSLNHNQLWMKPRQYLSNWVRMDLLVQVRWQFFQNHSSNQAWCHQKSVCKLSTRYRKMSNQPNEYKSKFQRNQNWLDLKFPHHCNNLNKILILIICVFGELRIYELSYLINKNWSFAKLEDCQLEDRHWHLLM